MTQASLAGAMPAPARKADQEQAPVQKPALSVDMARIRYGAGLIVAAFALLGIVFGVAVSDFSTASDVTAVVGSVTTVLGTIIGAASAAVALLIPWLPPAASVERDRIDVVFWVVTTICMAIFSLVAAVSIYSIFKFRAKRRGAPEPVAVHGNAPLEIGWTVSAIVLVAIVSVVTFLFLPGILDPPRTGPGGLQADAGVAYAQVGQAPEPLLPQVDRSIRETPGAVGVPVQAGDGLGPFGHAGDPRVAARRKRSARIDLRKTSSPNAWSIPSTWLTCSWIARSFRSSSSSSSSKSMASSSSGVTGGVPGSMNTLKRLYTGTHSAAHAAVCVA